MGGISELMGVEKPVTEWLSKMGWTFKSNDDLKLYNRPFSNPVISQILIEHVATFNSVSNDVAELAVEQLLQHLNNQNPIIGNENFLEKVVKGVTILVDGKDKDFYFIYFYDIWKNSLIVTNQYRVQGFKMVKTDIILLVNGIPLIPIEAKQRARKGTNWLEGVRQFSTYDQRADKLFMCHGFGVACNGRIAKYGIPGASSSYFNE